MFEFEESQAKAKILLEALPYVRRFRGSIFVVKYGGSFMEAGKPSTGNLNHGESKQSSLTDYG
jgi:hypothetical protein